MSPDRDALIKVRRILGESWRDCLEAAGRRTHLERVLSCLGLLKSVTCSKEIHSSVFLWVLFRGNWYRTFL